MKLARVATESRGIAGERRNASETLGTVAEELGMVAEELGTVAEESRTVAEERRSLAEERGNVAEKRGSPDGLQNDWGEKQIKSGEQRNCLSASRKKVPGCYGKRVEPGKLPAGISGNQARSWTGVAEEPETLRGDTSGFRRQPASFS